MLAQGKNDTSEIKDSITTTSTTSENYTVKKRSKNDTDTFQGVLKSLNHFPTPEEKLTELCKKYSSLVEENKKQRNLTKQSEKHLAAVIKEKEQIRKDHEKSILSRNKLEELCRGLQRQNKEIEKESCQKIQEEEEKRKVISKRFEKTLKDITQLMEEEDNRTSQLRRDNMGMTAKLKLIGEQNEIREQQFEKIAKQMAFESQHYKALLNKVELENSTEKETLLREKQQLLLTLAEYQTKFQDYQTIELDLRKQIEAYNSKYAEFEKSLSRSNSLFGGFKEEMEIMSKKIIKLESETAAWKKKWEQTQKALVEMASAKQISDREVTVTTKQLSALQSLCRTLQNDRKQLLDTLNKINEESGNSESALPTAENAPNKVINEGQDESFVLLSDNVAHDTDLNSNTKEICQKLLNVNLDSNTSDHQPSANDVNIGDNSVNECKGENSKKSLDSDTQHDDIHKNITPSLKNKNLSKKKTKK